MKKFIPVLLVCLMVLLNAASVFALEINSVNELKSRVLCRILSAMFWLFIVVSAIMVIWSAFLYLTSQGDAEKVRTATRSLTYSAIAVMVALTANTFPAIVASIFGSGSGLTACGR